MFNKMFYEQAVKCFLNAQEPLLEQRSLGYQKANQANETLIEVKNELNYLNQSIYNYSNMEKNQKKKIKAELKQKEKESFLLFYEAAEIFKKLGIKRKSA